MPDRLLLILLSALAGALLLVSLATGPTPLGLRPMIGGLVTGAGIEGLIMRDIRLPRALLALLIGGGYGLAGAALQGLLRNPLAEPSVFGAPQAAALGAVLALFAGGLTPATIGVAAAAIAGALVALTLLLAIAGASRSLTAFLLAGLAIASLAGALTTLVLNLAPNPFALAEIVYWLMGSLEDRAPAHLWLAAPPILLGGALLLANGAALRSLTLGEDVAASLGVRLGRLRINVVAATALIVGGATAAAGAIGFIGLVAPHLVRRAVGSDPARVLAPAMLAGASLLLAADILVRLIPANTELKLGVVTSLIGVPVFLWILLTGQRQDVS